MIYRRKSDRATRYNVRRTDELGPWGKPYYAARPVNEPNEPEIIFEAEFFEAAFEPVPEERERSS